MNEVLEFLQKYHVFYLATVEGDQPHVRPFGALAVIDGKLYTQTGKVKKVAQQLKANPKAEICCFGEGKWVRIECELIWDDSYETLHALLEQNPSLRRMYDENDGNCLGLRFENCTATFSSFTEPPHTVTF